MRSSLLFRHSLFNGLNMKLSLWQKILIGLSLGLICAYILGSKASHFKFLGTIFINLIKMTIIPLIFFSIVTAIINMKHVENVTKVAVKSVLTFVLSSISAAGIGILTSILLKPGEGKSFTFFNLTSSQDSPNILELDSIINNLVPSNIFLSLVEGNILQVILFACFVGGILNSLGDSTEEISKLFKQFSLVFFAMIRKIVQLAPIGVFGYISWTIGTQGFGVLFSLVKLIGTVFASCFIQYIVFGVFIILFARINPIPFYKKMLEPQVMAFSTSSSKATLSTTMQTLREKLGVSEDGINFVLPIGSSINMDGGAIYLAASTMFFVQALGINLEISNYCLLIFMCTIGSIGAAGIPGGILLFLGITFKSLGIPLEAVAIIVSLDCILDMMTTVVNVTGDACITLIIDKSEGKLCKQKYFAT